MCSEPGLENLKGRGSSDFECQFVVFMWGEAGESTPSVRLYFESGFVQQELTGGPEHETDKMAAQYS